MAKGNRRLRSVVEGAINTSNEARRAAAAEKIRASVTTPSTPAPAPPPEAPAKPKRTRPKKTEPEVEADTRLETSTEQRVPPPVEAAPPTMTPEAAQQLRETMLQSGRPKKRTTPKTQAAKPQPQKPASTSGFAPIRGPGALLGRLLKETYRQAPNIAANAIAIPAFTAAGAGGAYLGTAGTVAAIRGIGKLLAGPTQEDKPQEPLPEPTPKPADDYRSGFQRAIDQRRQPRLPDSGFDVIRQLSRTRGMS